RPDVVLREVTHPVRVAPGEAFALRAEIDAVRPAQVEVAVAARGREVARRAVALRAGAQAVRVDLTLTEPGATELDVRVLGFPDDVAAERSAVLVDAPLRVLHLSASAGRRAALAAALAPHGI